MDLAGLAKPSCMSCRKQMSAVLDKWLLHLLAWLLFCYLVAGRHTRALESQFLQCMADQCQQASTAGADLPEQYELALLP